MASKHANKQEVDVQSARCTLWNYEDPCSLPKKKVKKRLRITGEMCEGLLLQSPREIIIKPFEHETVKMNLWVKPQEGHVVHLDITWELQDQGLAVAAALYDGSSEEEIQLELWNYNMDGKSLKIKKHKPMAVMFLLRGKAEDFFSDCSSQGLTVTEEEFAGIQDKYKQLVLDGKVKRKQRSKTSGKTSVTTCSNVNE